MRSESRETEGGRRKERWKERLSSVNAKVVEGNLRSEEAAWLAGNVVTDWLLLLLLVLSRTFEKDLNMTETETTTCPLSYIQAGIVASTGLPFNDIFAPIWASVLRWLRSRRRLSIFAIIYLRKLEICLPGELTQSPFPSLPLPLYIARAISALPSRRQLFMAFIFASGDKMLYEIHEILCDNIQ